MQRTIAIASSILLIAKFWAYYLTGSVAVLTDALESIVNVVAGFIGLYSLYVAAKPRDMDHPYGHGKAEFISAAVEGTLVLSAGLLIIYTAVKNLFYPVSIRALDIGIYLVAGTAIVNWILGYVSLQKGKKNNSLALVASGKHLQTDTYSTLGIIIGLVLISVTGYGWIDSHERISSDRPGIDPIEIDYRESVVHVTGGAGMAFRLSQDLRATAEVRWDPTFDTRAVSVTAGLSFR